MAPLTLETEAFTSALSPDYPIEGVIYNQETVAQFIPTETIGIMQVEGKPNTILNPGDVVKLENGRTIRAVGQENTTEQKLQVDVVDLA